MRKIVGIFTLVLLSVIFLLMLTKTVQKNYLVGSGLSYMHKLEDAGLYQRGQNVAPEVPSEIAKSIGDASQRAGIYFSLFSAIGVPPV